jgi:hypothetical protein
MRSHKTLARLCVAVALFSAEHVRAQEVALNADGAAEKDANPRGTYCGVKAGGDETPAIHAKPGSTPPAITWPGFQMMPDGSSRVFVQITTQVDVSAALVNGKVVVDFGNVSIAGRNNRRPMITKFFNTPVTAVEVKRAQKRTTLILSMRAPVEPRVSHEQVKSGFHFVYIDFPPGTYRPTDAQAAASPNAPVDLPEAAKPDATARDAPTHLGGSAAASGQVQGSARASGGASLSAGASASANGNTSMDGERPPGMGKPKPEGKAKAGGKLKFGK